ncbi:6-phosphofructokinase [candidate division KSB1 bacterium]|nr:6-phosphofructokinase [candidate division KSB1 bacterium]
MPTETTPKVFISYKSTIKEFVSSVCHCLDRMSRIEYYFYGEKRHSGSFPPQIKNALKESNKFVLFLTEETQNSTWQLEELEEWLRLQEGNTDGLVIVNMSEKILPVHREGIKQVERIMIEDYKNPQAHVVCANEILFLLRIASVPFDDLPTVIDAKYEKDIIKLYKEHFGLLPNEYIRKGYPSQWPVVASFRGNDRLIPNPLDPKLYGSYRRDDSFISVDARCKLGNETNSAQELSVDETFSFPEAGPRSTILNLPNTLKAAILVSGGIAPGINAVISAIIDRHRTYEQEFRNKDRGNRLHRVEIKGCVEGFKSLSLPGGRIIPLEDDVIKNSVNRGGSILPTSRADQLMSGDPVKRSEAIDNVARTLSNYEIDILYVIGGEGSMRAAHAISTVFQKMYPTHRLSIIGIPKTMDNDILWVWQSFGFLSAVEKARKDIIQLSTEVISNPRVGIMQLFGSSSGFVVSHAALGSNVCDLALIPELDFTMKDVCRYMGGRLRERRNTSGNEMNRSPFGLIVMSETAIPKDFKDYIDESYVGLTREEKEALLNFEKNERKVMGQTPDALRNACLKIVSRVLQQYIQGVLGRGDNNALGANLDFQLDGAPDHYWQDFRVFTNEPRHLIRSMEPTVSDVAYGIRLATMAVDMALAGYTDCMVSQWLTEYVVVPLNLVVLGRKQLPKEGIFWKTVVSKTGQIEYDSLT